MRESLTILASLLIVILSTALAGPYLIDWNSQRGLIERRLSQALGENVRITGAIDLKILPTPYLTLGQIEVSDQTASARLLADDMQLEIAVTPLLRGEVDFTEVLLEKPRLFLTVAQDGALLLPRFEHGFSGELRFERLAIREGSVTISDPAQGRSYGLRGLDLDAEAGSLTGPYKGEGRVTLADEPAAFRFSTGAPAEAGLRLKLIIGETKAIPRAELDGNLSFRLRDSGAFLPNFAGGVNLSGRWTGGQPSAVKGQTAAFSLPWRVVGALQVDSRKAAFDRIEVRLGGEERALTAVGSAELDFTNNPQASLNLKSKQVDLDRLLLIEDAAPEPQRLAAYLEDFMASDGLAGLPLPLTLKWTADSILVGGETLTDLSTSLALKDGKAAWLRLATNGPARSHLFLDGSLETGTAAGFNGKTEASAGDLGRLADWIALAKPQWGSVLHDMPFRAFDMTGETAISRIGFVGRDLALRLNRSDLSGTIAYTRAVGSEPARLFADLNAQALDLDGLPDLQNAANVARSMDLALHLDARAVKVARIGKGTMDAGRIKLKLGKTKDEVRLEDFIVDGLGGTNISATAARDASGLKIDAKLDAAHLEEASALLHKVAPGPATDLLLARAASLSPARLGLHVEAVAGPEHDALHLRRLNFEGTTGTSKVAAKIDTDRNEPRNLSVSALIETPEAINLIRQFGFSVLPLHNMGPGRIEVAMQGPFYERLATRIDARLAGTILGFRGTVAPRLDLPEAAGRLNLSSPDLSPWLQATAMAFPDLTARIGADIGGDVNWNSTGLSLNRLEGSLAGTPFAGRLAFRASPKNSFTGSLDFEKLSLATLNELSLGPPQPPKAGAIWSDLKFTSGLIDPPLVDIEVRAKTFDLLSSLTGQGATLRVEIAPGRIAVRDLHMKLGEGSASGNMTLRRDGAIAAAEGHISLSNYKLDLPSIRGRVSGGLDVAGTGQSALGLVSGLAGSGTARLTDLTFPGSDPVALGRVFAAVEQDRLSVDENEVMRALSGEFDRDALRMASNDFDLGLAAGILRVTVAGTPNMLGNPDATSSFSASLDLRSLQLDQRVGLTLAALPKNWTGPAPQVTLNFKGPLANPARSLDAAGFINPLAARAIARESARIQSYEFDIHERAVFNQRLFSERRREQEKLQEKLKAEEDARRAAEAARLERQRKVEEEARRRAEDEAHRRVEEMLKRYQQPEPMPIPRPPTALESPPYRMGVPTDPSAAGRY